MANRILIIEDDPYISKMYQTKLRLAGFEVELADNGRIGLDKVKSFLPELILLDLMMPDMDGFEVLKMVKGDPISQNAPVMIMSNLGEEDHIGKAKQLGAIDYIVKNQFTPTEVIAKIQAIFDGATGKEKEVDSNEGQKDL